jgi:hypothetical protein
MIEGNTYRHTDWWEEFMKYAVGMDIQNFINIYSAIQKLIGGTQTHRQHGDRISLL